MFYRLQPKLYFYSHNGYISFILWMNRIVFASMSCLFNLETVLIHNKHANRKLKFEKTWKLKKIHTDVFSSNSCSHENLMFGASENMKISF